MSSAILLYAMIFALQHEVSRGDIIVMLACCETDRLTPCSGAASALY